MNRRGFFGALAALFAAPMVIAKAVAETPEIMITPTGQCRPFRDSTFYIPSEPDGYFDNDMDGTRIDFNAYDTYFDANGKLCYTERGE